VPEVPGSQARFDTLTVSKQVRAARGRTLPACSTGKVSFSLSLCSRQQPPRSPIAVREVSSEVHVPALESLLLGFPVAPDFDLILASETNSRTQAARSTTGQTSRVR